MSHKIQMRFDLRLPMRNQGLAKVNVVERSVIVRGDAPYGGYVLAGCLPRLSVGQGAQGQL